MPTVNKTIDSLQVLRGIAAILVVLFHMGLPQYRIAYPSINFFGFGFSGVDLFFVLSGFIIYLTQFDKKGIQSFKFFIIRRFIRIFPIYWFALFSALTIYYIINRFYSISNTHQAINLILQTGGIKLVLVSIFLLPFTHPPIISVSWTLSFEILFYLVFGLVFFFRPSFFLPTMGCWVTVCYLVYFIFPVDFDSVAQYSMVPVFNPIIAEFFFGCIAAYLYIKYSFKHWFYILSVGIILFSLSAALNLNELTHREIWYGIPAAFIVYGLAHVRNKFPRGLIYLGDASYSIYLFHVPILSVIAKSMANKPVDSVYLVAFLLIIIVGVTCMIYSIVEKPMLNFLNAKSKSFLLTSKPAYNLVEKTVNTF